MQEAAISEVMNRSVEQILQLQAEGGDFDREFAEVLDALQGGKQDDDLELF